MRSLEALGIVLAAACGGAGERPVEAPTQQEAPAPTASVPSPPVAPSAEKAPLLPLPGRLDPVIIQRVVRSHFDVLRRCYEDGLARDPNLSGRVVTRFVIDRNGAVYESRDDGSEMRDPKVVDCVVSHYRTMVFPEPQGGIVTVVYPIKFDPDDADAGVDAGGQHLP